MSGRYYINFPNGQRVQIMRLKDVLPYVSRFGEVFAATRYKNGKGFTEPVWYVVDKCDNVKRRPNVNKNKISCPSELWEAISGLIESDLDAEGRIQKSVYKYTDCGAWIEFESGGIKLGSIVEGTDLCTDAQILDYPFSENEYDEAITAVEQEACQIWDSTHGCPECWTKYGGYMTQYGMIKQFPGWPVNPECKECKGEGTII